MVTEFYFYFGSSVLSKYIEAMRDVDKEPLRNLLKSIEKLYASSAPADTPSLVESASVSMSRRMVPTKSVSLHRRNSVITKSTADTESNSKTSLDYLATHCFVANDVYIFYARMSIRIYKNYHVKIMV